MNGSQQKEANWSFNSLPIDEHGSRNGNLFGDGPSSYGDKRASRTGDDADADTEAMSMDMSYGLEDIDLPDLDDLDRPIRNTREVSEAKPNPVVDQFGIPINNPEEFDNVGLLVRHLTDDDDEIPTPMDDYGSSFDTPHGFHRSSSSASSSSMPTPEFVNRKSVLYQPYEFRPGPRIAGPPLMTWVDQDESGTYDPRHERRKPIPVSRKKKPSSLSGNRQFYGSEGSKDVERIPRKTKRPTLQQGQRTGESMVVTFRLFSVAGHDILQKGSLSDKWPDDGSDFSKNEDAPGETSDDFEMERSYKLRKRGAKQETLSDPRGVEEDLFGHPDARGCVRCRQNGHDCSLKHHGFSWPCLHCAEKDVNCELIIAPKYKDACLRCQDNEPQCSFTTLDYEEDGTPPLCCEECLAVQDFDCRAGPNKARQHQRLYINEKGRSDDWPDVEERPVAPRKYVACTICRQEAKRCSLKTKTDKAPCNKCKKEGLPCTFLDLRPPKPSKALPLDGLTAGTAMIEIDEDSSDETHSAREIVKQSRRPMQSKVKGKAKAMPDRQPILAPQPRPIPQTGPPPKRFDWHRALREAEEAAEAAEFDEDEELQRPTTPKERLIDADGHSGETCTIVTNYSHPITFAATPYDGEGQDTSCTWCSDNAYGILGLGEKEVFCIEWHTGLGYTEILGGHLTDGCPPSKMCFNCTVSRYQIIICDNHQLQRIPLLEQEDIDIVADQLTEAPPFSKQTTVLQDKFCSLCVSDLASFHCATIQDSLVENHDGETRIAGCGLKLCERCAVVLLRNCDGSLEKAIGALEEQAKQDQEKGMELPRFLARADLGLLKTSGLLYRNMEAVELEETDSDVMEGVE
jgi:hypothetical protein